MHRVEQQPEEAGLQQPLSKKYVDISYKYKNCFLDVLLTFDNLTQNLTNGFAVEKKTPEVFQIIKQGV
jgi:hypothetical protein